ncbi:glycosyltransferase [Flavobacterium luteum]|uniref:Glycosyltransferase n=1 Tax=Flavobacterium luteum TaxID=2026654 RepID=A0A7J5AG36_9FLAO|nr:glycosyltransferase [Flavobacterium luteum]KAB1156556.1 glycosyltransferase [Flavobacterium luteum]
MRIVQIIDSLEVGGAERMAVNYANALAGKISFSGLVVTRKEGNLKSKIEQKVNYLFLNKKKTLDWKAVLKLKMYCEENSIEMLQPHSSSYFIAVLVKLIYPKIQIVWHDHNGLSEFLSSQKWIPLKIASFLFKGIIVVNYQLKNWAVRELNCKNVIYLPNFTSKEIDVKSETVLKGNSGKRIVCLANLRHQKNHLLLIEVAKKLKINYPEWTFHLVGKDFEDEYSRELKNSIFSNKLYDSVFLYGSRADIVNIINQSEIGILTSRSEGLPLVLLEFGLYKKAVVVTNVGEIPIIIQDKKNGLLVPSENVELFYNSIILLIDNPPIREKLGEELFNTIMKNNSEKGVLDDYLKWLKEI